MLFNLNWNYYLTIIFRNVQTHISPWCGILFSTCGLFHSKTDCLALKTSNKQKSSVVRCKNTLLSYLGPQCQHFLGAQYWKIYIKHQRTYRESCEHNIFIAREHSKIQMSLIVTSLTMYWTWRHRLNTNIFSSFFAVYIRK